MLHRRLFNHYVSRSLRTKVTLGVALPLLIILGFFTVIEYARQRAVLLDNLSLLASNAGQVIENNLRHEMLQSDFEGVQKLLDSIGADQAFRKLYLIDTSGEIIFAPQEKDVGRRLDNTEADCQPCHALPPEDRPDSIVVMNAEGQRVFRSMQPIVNSEACDVCHDPEQRLIGMLLTDMSISSVEVPLAAYLRENLLWWAGIILVTILVVNITLSTFVLRRIEDLASAISLFGRGQNPPPLQDNQPDEIGQLAEAFNTMAEKVETRNQEVRSLSEHLIRQNTQRGELLKRLITAQEDERKRVARELHDELGQIFGGLALRLEATERYLDQEPHLARKQLNDTKKLVANGTDKMYDLILALRPSALDDLGLVIALGNYIERLLSDAPIDFDFDVGGMNGRLPPDIETALYRIYQEALSNVLRHSQATYLSIKLACNQDEFEGSIQDNGQGFDLNAVRTNRDGGRGLGLLGMEERAYQCGGTIDIASNQDGTRIHILIPFDIIHNERSN